MRIHCWLYIFVNTEKRTQTKGGVRTNKTTKSLLLQQLYKPIETIKACYGPGWRRYTTANQDISPAHVTHRCWPARLSTISWTATEYLLRTADYVVTTVRGDVITESASVWQESDSPITCILCLLIN